uniref:TonB-dependent receptor n=1 Tax=Roseihalotalea indica TaxID=2867963 RepID=A0AA49JDC2_9BACT|nr:hypothetical protein K4G66_30125 [Tunicatimonas sp. TK19036]
MKAFFGILFIFLSLTAWAQETETDWDEEGEIDDAEVVIEKEREITLPTASRRFERVPPLPITKPTTAITYQFQEVTPTLPGLRPQVRPLKIKNPPLDPLYGNYAKVGFGNFLTPYAELFANNTRNDEYDFGVHLYHLSSRYGPVDGANSGNSDTRLGLNTKYFATGHTFHAEASYQRERYHFYGYSPLLSPEPERDSIKQLFNTISVSGGISREEVDEPLDYDVNAKFIHIDDAYNASENQVELNLEASYVISSQLGIGVESDLYLMQRADQNPETLEDNSLGRRLFRARPYFTYQTGEPGEGLMVKGGFNVVYENDTANNADQLHIYPYALATLHLSESFQVYAGVDGDVEATSLYSFTRENPYLEPNVPLLHTNRNFTFRGGVKGRATSFFGIHLGVAASNYKNLYFYANSALDSTRFTILYASDNAFQLNLFGEITLNSSERFRSSLRGDFYAYDLNDVDEPWHRPTLTVSWLNSLNLYEKILLNAELQYLSGIQGLNLASGNTRELDPIVDLSFQGDYLFSNRFSAFIKVKNIFAQNYERFLNYPSRGIMFMGGVSYSF